MRYPGHRDLMKFLLQDLNLSCQQELLRLAQEIRRIPVRGHRAFPGGSALNSRRAIPLCLGAQLPEAP